MDQVKQLDQLLRAFNWHAPSWDLFIILFWIVGSLIYAFAAGRGRILTVLVSVYISKLIVLEAPFLSDEVAKRLHVNTIYLQQLVTFGILFGVLFAFLSRYGFKSTLDNRRLTSLAFSVAFAFLQIGLLINIVVGFLSDSIKDSLSPLVHFIFVQYPANFVWLVLPVAFLVVAGKFAADRDE